IPPVEVLASGGELSAADVRTGRARGVATEWRRDLAGSAGRDRARAWSADEGASEVQSREPTERAASDRGLPGESAQRAGRSDARHGPRARRRTEDARRWSAGVAADAP